MIHAQVRKKGMLIILLAIVVSAVSLTCPDTTSSCPLNCSSPVCTGALDCSTNTNCSLTCTDDRSCAGVQVTGVSNGLSDFAVDCQGDHSCENAIFNAKPAALTRFSCSGNHSCIGASFNCGNNNCEFVCDEASACQDISLLKCAGGLGKSCAVTCNGGCDSSLKVVCANYPCNVSITGSGMVSPCPPDKLLCGDRSCVSPGTSCPSQCISGDPCNTGRGNTCKDVGAMGGPYNCTCTVPGYEGTAVGNLVQSCRQVVGYGQSLTISTTPSTFGSTSCGGKSQRAVTWPSGCGRAPIGGDGFTQKYSSCTATKWCQSDCGSPCIPSRPVGECINNVRVTCNNIFNGAATASVQTVLLVILLSIVLQ